jgi:hypothetical protein
MKKYEEIKGLLDKYFEGNTSLQEEQDLRNYFSSKTVDKDLSKYAPLFQYFKTERTGERKYHSFYGRNIMLRSLIGAAACVLLVLGFVLSPDRISTVEDEFGCTGTYVRIEGTCYNDLKLVFSHAAQAISDLDILLAEDHSCTETNNNETQ